MTFSIPDLIVTIAYFSIPLQIVAALCKFPRLTRQATKRVVALLILFALFIFLCGAGHLIRCLGLERTTIFRVVNILTAAVSLVTSVYLLPFVPHLLYVADKLYLEATTSKKIIESMYPPTIRERLLRRDCSTVVGGEVVVIKGEGDSKCQGGAKPQNRSLLHRLSHSESTALRRIHVFIQRKRVTPVSFDDSCEDLWEDIENGFQGCEPIADNFPNASIMFADISNFTYWSSKRSPNDVFTLLECLFYEFDQVAKQMSVFKVSTVGDCYIASTGVPYPREDHAVVLTKFAERCRQKANEVMNRFRLSKELEMDGLGKMRIGIHSGPITAGVLRGDKARFDLFGDTINTAARIESTGEPDRIQLSEETAELLKQAGKGDWLIPRNAAVAAKGKGELNTFWLKTITFCDVAQSEVEVIQKRQEDLGSSGEDTVSADEFKEEIVGADLEGGETKASDIEEGEAV